MGAWIETEQGSFCGGQKTSHPVWVRGLKLEPPRYSDKPHESHPVWVRGLKLEALKSITAYPVAPRVGAWIETVDRENKLTDPMSHPVWVRGLKHGVGEHIKIAVAVAPRVGAWIETSGLCDELKEDTVAPRVGAWIETSNLCRWFYSFWSHPVWVRGLKHSGPSD